MPGWVRLSQGVGGVLGEAARFCWGSGSGRKQQELPTAPGEALLRGQH